MKADSNAKQEAQKRKDLLESSVVGKKVKIRGVEADDLPNRVEWINDPAIQMTLNFQYPMSVAKATQWLAAVAKDYSRRDFSLISLKDNKYIGFGGFINIDMTVKKAELYIAIGDKNYWGGGYGFDAYKLITRYGFLELGLNRIYGYQLVFNRAASTNVERLGWKTEGCLRQDIFAHGELRDRNVVSIMRDEWLALNKDSI